MIRSRAMDIGIVGLGRMGGNMARRLARRDGTHEGAAMLAPMRKGFGGHAVSPRA